MSGKGKNSEREQIVYSTCSRCGHVHGSSWVRCPRCDSLNVRHPKNNGDCLRGPMPKWGTVVKNMDHLVEFDLRFRMAVSARDNAALRELERWAVENKLPNMALKAAKAARNE